MHAEADFLIYGKWDTVINTGVESYKGPAVLLQYSSGTTGEPKLVVRSWEDVDVEINSYNLKFNADPGEEPILLVPVSHSFALIAGALASIARGTAPRIISTLEFAYLMNFVTIDEKTHF